MTDLQEALDQIKERNKSARHHNRMPQIKSGDRDIYEKLLDSQADVPRLVEAIEAVLDELAEQRSEAEAFEAIGEHIRATEIRRATGLVLDTLSNLTGEDDDQ